MAVAERATAPDDTEGTTSGTSERPLTVKVEDLHIKYRVYEDRRPTLRQLVARGFKPRHYREIHAVRGVCLEARQGESIGIIGRNGSGKSTFMQAVAGLLPANSGHVYAVDQPAILGVNAALQKNLSGRRNIVLGGMALGLSRREVGERMDDIIDFAGVRNSIDLPLGTFSSGMRARLHFSIATAVLPDILLIDEALAVGDEDFRVRSEARIKGLTEGAGTVFLVSHSLSSVIDTCSRAVWMDDGEFLMDGDPEAVIKEYKKATAANA
jgi:teichoic acid transport system ATP-binding protein